MLTESKLIREQTRVQIVALKNEGLSLKEISQKTGKHRRTIQRICKRVEETKSFKDKQRSGRPKVLDERKRRIIARILEKSNIKTAEQVRKEAKQFHNIDVSRDTI